MKEIKNTPTGKTKQVMQVDKMQLTGFNHFEQKLLKSISEHFHNLNYLTLNNEFCILFQGLLRPLDFDFYRITKDWDEVEGDFFMWYERLHIDERIRLIEYYTNKGLNKE